MNNNLKSVAAITLLIFSFAFAGDVNAWQEVMVSQKAMVSQTINTTVITVIYHRPGVKGRIIFGELVPYGEHWRTGANAATTIEFSKDVTVNSKPLAAGKYGFWTIPRENGNWTLVFTSNPDLPGTPYEPGNEILEVDAKAEAADHEEYMRFSFPVVSADSGILALRWDKLMVPINIEAGN